MNGQNHSSDNLLTVRMEDAPGIMAKLTGLINRRGFAIKSFSAGKDKQENLLRITLKVESSTQKNLHLIEQQLFKVPETVEVSSVDQELGLQREMALVKWKSNGSGPEAFQELVQRYAGKVLSLDAGIVIAEITGPTEKIDEFVSVLPGGALMEIARTGIVAMNRQSEIY